MWRTIVYPKAKYGLLTGAFNWASDTFKVATLTEDYAYSAGHEFFSSVSGDELPAGAGYVVGGTALTGNSVGFDSGNLLLRLEADDLFHDAEIEPADGARYAVVYKSTGTPSTSRLLGFIDFGSIIGDENTNLDPQFGYIWNNHVAGVFRSVFTFKTGIPGGQVVWYSSAATSFANGETDLLTHDLKMALLADTYTADIAGHATLGDVSGDEVTGTGYSAGGVLLTGPSLTVLGDIAKFDLDDATFANVTIGGGARYGVIYNDSASQRLLFLVGLGAVQTPAGEDLVIRFPPAGVITL